MHALPRLLFLVGALAPDASQQREVAPPVVAPPPIATAPKLAPRPFDVELLAALTAFEQATSYRFALAATAPAAWSAATTFELEGRHAADAPLRLEGGGIEAYRNRGRIAFRLQPSGEWQRMRAPARATAALASGAPPLTLLPYFARVLAPHQLLERGAARLLQATPVAEGAELGVRAFDCLLERSLEPRVSGGVAPLRLRLAIRAGALVEVALLPVASFQLDVKALSPPAAAELLDFTLRYVLLDLDATTVDVPDAAARLLAD